MEERRPKYSLDTSAFMHAWYRSYPPDVFPTFWELFDRCVGDGIVVASAEVFGELERKADELHTWCKERRDMFRDIDDKVQEAVAEIMERFPKLVDERTSKSEGDPWVIGLARSENLIVVSEENGGSDHKPKIPNVCSAYGIRCIKLLDFIRELGWRI